MRKFTDYLRMEQDEIKCALQKDLDMESHPGFLYRKGTVPIMLVAHMDTIHKSPPHKIKVKRGKMYSPQGIGGDDRCGIWMILNILKECDCYVVFTEDEECGCFGAKDFAKSEIAKQIAGSINYIIECDRRGEKDAVFYDLDNSEFEDFVLGEYWKYETGTYTDTCEIAPALKCAAVNLSCGYYYEHTANEYINLSEMERNIKEIVKLIERSDDTFYEYTEFSYYKKGMYCDTYTYKSDAYCICYDDAYTGDHKYAVYEADSWVEAVGKFMLDYPEMQTSLITGVYDEFFEVQYM